MSRGGRGNEVLNALLAGKEYKDSVIDVVKTTAVRATDFDQKAVALLDALEQNGRAKEACLHVKQALEGLTRDRVGNWRGYVYTLLRGFDEASYNSMKASKPEGTGKKRRGSREEVDKKESNGESVENPQAPVTADEDSAGQQKPKFNVGANEFVPSTKPPSSSKAMSKNATVFVPGQPWASSNSNGQPTTNRPGQRSWAKNNAAEFVPGHSAWQLQPGIAPPPGNHWGQPALSHGAVEFVPGRHAWTGAPYAPASRAGMPGVYAMPTAASATQRQQHTAGRNHPQGGGASKAKGSAGKAGSSRSSNGGKAGGAAASPVAVGAVGKSESAGGKSSAAQFVGKGAAAAAATTASSDKGVSGVSREVQSPTVPVGDLSVASAAANAAANAAEAARKKTVELQAPDVVESKPCSSNSVPPSALAVVGALAGVSLLVVFLRRRAAAR